MAGKRVAKHRAANRPVTPVTVMMKNLAEAHTGRKALAIAGSGMALGAIAASAPLAQPSTPQNSAAVDTAKVAASALDQVAQNPAVKAEAGANLTQAGAINIKAVAVNETVETKAEEKAAPVAAAAAAQVDYSQVGGNHSGAVGIAARYLGTPYVFGGKNPGGFDCSGFVSYVYGQMGIAVPANTEAMPAAGQMLPLSAAQPGDILWRHGHAGIYVGDGKVIHATMPGRGLSIDPISWGGFTNVIRAR